MSRQTSGCPWSSRPQLSHLGISWDVYDRITNPGLPRLRNQATMPLECAQVSPTRSSFQLVSSSREVKRRHICSSCPMANEDLPCRFHALRKEDEYCESPAHPCKVQGLRTKCSFDPHPGEEAHDCNVGDPQVQRMAGSRGCWAVRLALVFSRCIRRPQECQNGFCMRRQWCPAENENWATTEVRMFLISGEQIAQACCGHSTARRTILSSRRWSCGSNLMCTTISVVPGTPWHVVTVS